MLSKSKFLPLFLSIIGLLVLVINVSAQTYSFQVPSEIVDVYWNKEGTLSISYKFTFTNSPNADPIDYIDIGVPTSAYELSSVTAFVNGNPIQNIEKSPYVKNGFALGLGQNSILPGYSGIVVVNIPNVQNVLYTDSEDSNYASAVFSPTWFGSEFVTGNTNLTVIYHLPPGVTPEEPRWHSAPSGFPSEPSTGFDDEGRITYTWNNPSASASTQYKFGASFPKKYVPETAIVAQSINVDAISQIIFSLACFGIPLAFIGLIIMGIIKGQKRRLQYLPPKISIEGHGIKRGLTAIEAAILLEQPLDKVLTMILFSVIKKGAAKVISKDPFQIEEIQPLPDSLRPYEKKFIDAFKQKTQKQRQDDLQQLVIELVREVQEKMRGFSRRETIDYYEAIVRKAWNQVETAETPEIKIQKFDEGLEWTMLDNDYDDHTRRVFREGPVFVPTWWSRYDPQYRPHPAGGNIPTSSTTPSYTSLPHLPGSDFAASIVNSVQNVSASAIGNLTQFTSSVTNKTNPIPVSTSPSRSSSRSGGGCACACACACAGCACACAGGGR